MTTPARVAIGAGPERLRVAAVVALLAVAASYNQPGWPATWLDEGFVTNGAETVLERGLYASWSFEGPRMVDQPLVANGPGVVLPVAASLRVLGVGLWQARVTAVIFMVLCGLVLYLTSRRLGGPLAGLVTIAVVLAMPREGFLYFGRMAMGNVPALAYFFTGVLVWMTALARRRTALALAAGLLFGVAAVTKAQWSVVLVPSLLVVWLVDRTLQRPPNDARHAAAFVGTVGVVALWYAARFALLGAEGFARDLAAVQSSAQWTVFAFDPVRRTPGSVWYLLRSGIWVVWLLGVGYATWTAWERSRATSTAILLATVATAWLTWYAIVSVGWERYAFEPLVMSAVLAGAGIAHGRERWTGATAPSIARWRWLAAALVALLVAYVAAHGLNRVRDLTAAPDTSAQDFSAVLERLVGPADVVESWEWQLDVLTDRRVHHPPNVLVDRHTGRIFFGAAVDTRYDWREWSPAFLVDGPFSKFTAAYAPDLASGCCALVASSGPYDLYRVTAAAGAQRTTR